MELADIIVTLRVPKGVGDDFEVAFAMTDPEGGLQQGTILTNLEIQARCIPVDKCRMAEVTGEIQPADPQGVSTYEHFAFADVAYNGTWTLQVDVLKESHMGQPHGVRNNQFTCAYVGFSEPNGTARVFSGDNVVESRNCVANGAISYSWGGDFTVTED